MFKGLVTFQGRFKILHLTWFAFFLTFVCWFNFAPFATTVGKELNLTVEQIKTLAICNLALTIPARIIIGMILDKFGPRITFSGILFFALVPCTLTAIAGDFQQLVTGRLLMGIVGAGFVVGIRMVSEWFPPKQIGTAEGIYGGWGNFGAFGAEFTLPTIAIALSFLSGNATNWRATIALTGIIAATYGLIYLFNVRDTPPGATYRKPKKVGAMEVTSKKSFYAMILSNFGLIFALGLLAWRLSLPKLHFLTPGQMWTVWGCLALLFAYQSYKAYRINRELLRGEKTYSPDRRYEFRQIALLEYCYAISFGSELAVVSMLPAFLEKTFSLDHVIAGMIAAIYPLLNLVSRPGGGLLSDRLHSRKWTMTFIAGGIGVGYLLAHDINNKWPLGMAIVVIIIAACFAQAGCGATYGMVPLQRREITGQISGNVGAYGNFGGVIYLTIFSLTDAGTLFTVMGIAALICASLCAFFLEEPRNSFASHYAEEGIGEENSEALPGLQGSHR